MYKLSISDFSFDFVQPLKVLKAKGRQFIDDYIS